MRNQRSSALNPQRLLILVCLGACVGASTKRAGDPEWALAERWLTCEECMNGELNAVVARGTAIVPALTRALEGPPDSVTVTLARSTGESFSAMRTQFDRESPADQALRPLGDSTEYVRTALANFRRAYQIRAAVALHAINPTNARVLFRRYIVADSTGAARALDPVLRRQLDSLVNTPP